MPKEPCAFPGSANPLIRTLPHSGPGRIARRAWLLFLSSAAAALALAARAQLVDPLPVDILQTSSLIEGNYLFIGQTGPGGLTPLPNAIQGPEILDNLGRPVWFLRPPNNQLAADFRVQTYQGNPVLTWAQGPGFEDTTKGATTDYIYNSSYQLVATVQAGNGYNADEHEFQLTPQGTALITIFNVVPYDLSSLGGPTDGLVMEGIAQEIDVATGAVLLEWHSLQNVPLTESAIPVPTTAGTPYDYFHINSVKLDTDGNLLISSRNCSTVYKVNRTTGAIIWRLGGKASDFTLGAGLPFAFQHDVEAADSQTLRIFDNESDGAAVLPASRAIWVTHDDTTMTATLKESIQHPAGLSVFAEGSVQSLGNGDTLVDWGILGRYSEFDPNGNLLYDVNLATGYNSYRAFRSDWTGTPTTVPTVETTYNSDGTTTVHAIWNGATSVANWQILTGTSSGSLAAVTTTAWNGLDTSVVVPGQPSYFQVVALDSGGSSLGMSAVTGGTPTFAAEPSSQTIARGRAVAFSAPAVGGTAVVYQWSCNGVALTDGSVAGATISGATGPTLLVDGATAANAGTYTCTVTDAGGAATSDAAQLVVVATTDVGRLINVSTRAGVGTGADVLIEGFVVGGAGTSGTETVLVRASGPALANYSVTGYLPDPDLVLAGGGSSSVMELATQGGNDAALVATTSAEVGAFAWTSGDTVDQAAVASLAPGPYTAEIAGASGDTGIALAEVFDATPAGTYTPALPRLVNVSARTQVGTGGNILIAGFVIGGSTAETLLVRASGPALAGFGISGTLSDPELQIYGGNGSTLIATNIGWGGNAEIAAVAAAVGAFPWSSAASADSALLITLAPGSYTAEVVGASGDTGVGLVEVYEVQ